MEPDHSSANGTELEEIPHISTLNLAQLEASLAQQEAYSREALGNAFSDKQEAERHKAAATQCEANARTSRLRYEEAELVIHELCKAVVERNKQMLEEQLESSHARASEKRQHVRDVHSE